VIALLASGAGQPTLVFAQSPGQKSNMGQLMKESMAQLGGRAVVRLIWRKATAAGTDFGKRPKKSCTGLQNISELARHKSRLVSQSTNP